MNVNALAPGQQLSFSEKGMTIVYGENGSGKSGYVRILKSACRARLDKNFTILGNIYSANPAAPQTATIVYFDGSTKHTSHWVRGGTSDPVLSAISVFDTNAGSIHVAGTNDIAYTPFPLLVLGRLARAADALREKLAAEVRQLEAQVPPTVTKHQCSPETKTSKLLQTLNGKTKAADVEALSMLSGSEKAELTSLRRDLADDPAVIASRSLKLAQRLENLKVTMSTMATALNEEGIGRILALKHEIATKGEALRRDGASVSSSGAGGDQSSDGSSSKHATYL